MGGGHCTYTEMSYASSGKGILISLKERPGNEAMSDYKITAGHWLFSGQISKVAIESSDQLSQQWNLS